MKIRLVDVGPKKIAVIKAIRVATGHNLRDAKDLMDRAPVTFKVNADANKVKDIVQEFRDAGAKIQVEMNTSVIDKMTAASYIATAEVALGEGNVSECRNCLRSALRLLGDFPDDVEYVGAGDL